MAKLTKREAGILGRYARGLDPVDPEVLERLADHILDTGARRKVQVEYPFLTERQRRTRLSKEVPLGSLIELVSANPAARFPIGGTPVDPADWRGDLEEAA